MNELSNVTKSDVARMAAGLQLKNYLTSKSVEVKVRMQQTWLLIDPGVRQHIKTVVCIIQICATIMYIIWLRKCVVASKY